MDKKDPKYLQAVELIKTAILQSQYNAIPACQSGATQIVLRDWPVHFGELPHWLLGYRSAGNHKQSAEE